MNGYRISCAIALRCMPQGVADDYSTLAQVTDMFDLQRYSNENNKAATSMTCDICYYIKTWPFLCNMSMNRVK